MLVCDLHPMPLKRSYREGEAPATRQYRHLNFEQILALVRTEVRLTGNPPSPSVVRTLQQVSRARRVALAPGSFQRPVRVDDETLRPAADPVPRPPPYARDALAPRGRSPKIVSERLGHASVAFTLDNYSHVLLGMQAEAALRLDQRLRRASGR